ncbi:hypothetical protein O181_119385 [Austropuccinia psidii MF-1]|uniref:Uncharacterized protein n=1 Tax=Austropuccinia psidii MF-1 TaxID=1389203 RepID=A0A9Q3KI56_9BASI|nr:hypothetical protein [Austropuccinia psidii MF-1]
MVTSKQLQPVASSSRRREERSPFLFAAKNVFQRREQWPVCITQEDPNMVNEGQDSVPKIFRRLDRNSREIIMYANDRMIPGTSSEGMASNFVWYEDELINYFQRTFDYLGKDD